MRPEELKYAPTHEWIESTGRRRKVGISHFAQEQMGDIVYVEFPAADKAVQAGDEACFVESSKAASSVYAPLPGRIVAYNNVLHATPEKINQDPYGQWLFELEVDEDVDESKLLGFGDYQQYCEAA